MADWSWGLPRDLIASILQGLPLRDWIHFGAVCKAWRSSVAEIEIEIGYPPPQHPWLLLPRTYADELNDTCNFYSLSDKIEYKIHLPGVRWDACIGVSEGWLVLYSSKGRKMCLLNPLTKARIRLPSLPRGFCQIKSRINQAAVSWSSASSYTVVVLRNDSPVIGFARSGDDVWTKLRGTCQSNSYYGTHELVYHKGMFYILSDGHIEVLDLTRPSPKFSKIVGTSILDRWISLNEPSIRCWKLVESSSDDLFLLMMIKPRGFSVFKLDSSGTTWMKAQTLGNHPVILGRYLSMSIPAHNFPRLKEDGLKENDGFNVWYYNDHHRSIPQWFGPNLL